MSREEVGNYGDESYPFCMNEAKNTAGLHKVNCNNPSRRTIKPARVLAGNGVATGINQKALEKMSNEKQSGMNAATTGGLTVDLGGAAPQTGVARRTYTNHAIMARAHLFRFLRQMARCIIH